MRPELGDICFWVTGDQWPNFTKLHCDLVFVVQEKLYWTHSNKIERSDPIVDSDQAWQDHYRWGNKQHQYKRRQRYTLKADADKSFQPQRADGSLIDIVPFLTQSNYTIESLRKKARGFPGAKPFHIDDVAQSLYDWLFKHADIKHFGRDLKPIRVAHTALGSNNRGGVCC